jgi:Putative MetA-pathway of phenol degradation
MRSLRAVFLTTLWLTPAICAAQDLTPRAYLPVPVSANAVIVTYAWSDGDITFDPTLPVTDVTGTIKAPVLSYYNAFSFFGRSANVTGSLPFIVGDISGKLRGQDAAIHRAGVGDTVVRMAVNLRGGPALTPAQFAKSGFPRSVLGTSLKVVVPTGQYDHTHLINIGTNRWAFKPEVGYMRRLGPVVVDGYAGLWLFTANDDFFASSADAQGSRRTQDRIAALEFHVSKDVIPSLWIAADFNYWHGGRTGVNGVKSDATLQSNSRLGVTSLIRLNRRHSLKVSYSEGAVTRVGGDFRTLSVGWQYGWFGMPLRKP